MAIAVVIDINGAPVPVIFDDNAIAAIAVAVAERLPDPVPRSPWLLCGAKAAADYLGMPLGRVEKLTAKRLIPCWKDGRRLVFDTRKLDEWAATGFPRCFQELATRGAMRVRDVTPAFEVGGQFPV